MKTCRCFTGSASICLLVVLAAVGAAGQQPMVTSYTLKIPPEISSVANHLNHGDNTLGEILPTVPEGTLLYKFDTARQIYTVNQFQSGAWLRPNETLAPGEGALIRNPGEEFSLTFSGTTPVNIQVPELIAGYNLIGLPAPGESALPPGIGGDRISEFDSTVQNFRTYTFDDLDKDWVPRMRGLLTEPGKSFFYRKLGPTGPTVVPDATVYFNTHLSGTVDARIVWDDGTRVAQGFTAQLYGGPAGTPTEQLVPLFTTTSFQTASAALRGYVNPVLVTLPAIAANTSVTLVMRVFNGATFESSTLRGETAFVTVRAGGGLYPPANLVGMPGFSITRPPEIITFERSSSGLTLTYTGTLQAADIVSGPYTDVPGATSPTTVTFRNAAAFYRVKP